jgi:ParB family chromosome partitioning protein
MENGIPIKELMTVQVHLIDRPKISDRIDIEEEEIASLADTIEEVGLLQPPILRKLGGRHEIVAGDRRILAIKRLGYTNVECFVCLLTDKQTAIIRGIENLERVNLSVIEEARIYKNLRDKYEMRIDQIAKKVKRSPGIVKRRLDLLKMPDCLINATHKKLISYGVAEALWVITDESALDYYLTFATEHGITVAIARQWAQDWKSSQRRITQGNEDPMEAITPPQIRPTYIACDICDQPELIQNLEIVRVCKDCAKLMREAGGD